MKTAEEIARKYLVIDELPRNPEKHGADIFFWSDIIRAMEEYANECVKAKCTLPVVSGSLPLASECDHPYAFVYRKCDYEVCQKCGKVLCEG